MNFEVINFLGLVLVEQPDSCLWSILKP